MKVSAMENRRVQAAGKVSGAMRPSATEFYPAPRITDPALMRLENLRALAGHAGASFGLCSPVVEPGLATFYWRGEADAVWLQIFMAQNAGPLAFERILHSDIWRLRLSVPDRARFEYKIDIVRSGHSEWINDPLNTHLATDPFGANSVCMTSGYSAPEWARENAGIDQGEVETFGVASNVFGGERQVGVYLPAGFDEHQTYPLVVVHDGFDYIDHASLVPVLDNLIERGDIPPVIAALTQSPDRSHEYVDDPRHAEFVADELVTAMQERYPLDERPSRRVLMGASLGAVACLSVVARAPQAFNGVVLKSGSFIFDPRLLSARSAVFGRVSEFIESLSVDERHLRRAYVTCGRYEGLVCQNREMAAYLRGSGIATRYREGRDAHHWQNWRDQTRAGLMWCLQGPNPILPW